MLLDANGSPLPAHSLEARVEAAAYQLARDLAGGMYGTDGEARVRELRTAVLGGATTPALVGLDAQLRAEGK